MDTETVEPQKTEQTVVSSSAKGGHMVGLATILAGLILIAIASGVAYWLGTRSANKPISTQTTSGRMTNQNTAANSTSTGSSTTPSSGSGSAGSSAQTTSPASTCGNLVLSKGTSNGTAGTIYWDAVITNKGAQACQLAGYPTAFMIDAQSLSVGASANNLYPPTTVTLAANGGQAHVVIGLPDPGAFSPGTATCTAAASSKLNLYLPGLTTPLIALFGESACDGFSVTALQPGA